jgi:hypothetical protein
MISVQAMPTERSALFTSKMIAFGGAKYLRTCAKNLVKLSIGRKPFKTAQDILFLHCVRDLCGTPIRRITCRCSAGEGAGSQALMIMRAMTFASVFKLQYVHTPFTEIAHADRPMPDYAAAWEGTFNFGQHEQHTADVAGDVINFAFTYRDLLPWFGLNDLCQLTPALSSLIPSFQDKFRATNPRPAAGLLRVAVHIRRGDVPEGDAAWTANDIAARTVTAVTSLLNARSIGHTVKVFSEGVPEDFDDLRAVGAELCLDADAITAMQEMANADIVITAKSCFSHVAALLSDGIKLTPFDDHPPLASWLRLAADGRFDEAAFNEQLDAMIASKRVKTRPGLVSS